MSADGGPTGRVGVDGGPRDGAGPAGPRPHAAPQRIGRVARPSGPAFVEVRDDHVALIDPHPFTDFTVTDTVAPIDEVTLLAPILPTKVVGVGKNYAEHAAELADADDGGPGRLAGGVPAEPLIFLKPPTSVIGPDQPVRLPPESDEVHHEAELAVVVGRMLRRADRDEALAGVLGLTCANDVTARDLQRRDGQWARAKGYDTFCPLGPWLTVGADPLADREVTCRVDGRVRQHGRTAQMVHDVGDLLAWVSTFTTLLPGDVLLTGTPAGVGPLADGERVEVAVDGLGTLANPVAAERAG